MVYSTVGCLGISISHQKSQSNTFFHNSGRPPRAAGVLQFNLEQKFSKPCKAQSDATFCHLDDPTWLALHTLQMEASQTQPLPLHLQWVCQNLLGSQKRFIKTINTRKLCCNCFCRALRGGKQCIGNHQALKAYRNRRSTGLGKSSCLEQNIYYKIVLAKKWQYNIFKLKRPHPTWWLLWPRVLLPVLENVGETDGDADRRRRRHWKSLGRGKWFEKNM